MLLINVYLFVRVKLTNRFILLIFNILAFNQNSTSDVVQKYVAKNITIIFKINS